MRTEVYSWRVSSNVKSDLEREARRRKMPVSAVLDAAVRDWLQKNTMNASEQEEQKRLQTAAASCLGVLDSHDARRSETAAHVVRQRLRQRYGR